MGPVVPALAAIGGGSAAVGAGVALTAVGTAASIYQGQRQASSQRRAQRAQDRLMRARQVRENQQAIRARRAAAAQVASRSEAMGVAGSSGEAGAISSIGAQTGANIGFAGMQRGIGSQISSFNQAAATAAGRAQLGQTVAGIGGELMGPEGLAGVFEQAGSKSPERWIGEFGGTWTSKGGYTR